MVIVLMGVSGSGKTTIGNMLSERTGIPFFDGDNFHPDINIRKMTEGIPLTDRNRMSWIEEIANFMNSSGEKHKILACSALNRFIRTLIIKKIKEPCYFIFLKGSYALIKKRMDKRVKHYMKSSMLASQFETLEEPVNALVISIEKSPALICDAIYNAMRGDNICI